MIKILLALAISLIALLVGFSACHNRKKDGAGKMSVLIDGNQMIDNKVEVTSYDQKYEISAHQGKKKVSLTLPKLIRPGCYSYQDGNNQSGYNIYYIANEDDFIATKPTYDALITIENYDKETGIVVGKFTTCHLKSGKFTVRLK